MQKIKPGSILLQQLKISWIPLVISFGWAIWSYQTTNEERTVRYFLKELFTALFFTMWFVGQYLRTAKDLRDKTNYGDIQIGIDELRNSLTSLSSIFRANHTEPAPSTTTTTTTTTTIAPSHTSNFMLSEAIEAVNEGFVLAGLMQAGVAFEQSIIDAAVKRQIVIDNRTTTAQLLNKLKEYYEKSTIQELFAVWKLRNQLIHLNPEASQEIKSRPHLIKYFIWAIEQLEK